MRIVVNDIAASEGGALSVLKNFYDEIIDRNDHNEWIFLLGDNYLKGTDEIRILTYPEIKSSWIKRLFFDLFTGKNLINKLQPDIYISFQNTATLGVDSEQFVYLHQVLPFQKEKNFSFFVDSERRYAVYQKIIGAIIKITIKKSNAKVIVQTKWLKKRLEKELSENCIHVVSPVVYPAKEAAASKKVCKEGVSFFYPASDLVYKNHSLIYQAVNLLVEKGYQRFQVILTIDKPSDTLKNAEYYQFLGKIDNEDIWEYYVNSTLLFPSYIESYGLPLKEASIVNSVIFASDTEFCREILESYSNAFFFDPFDAEKLAELMERKLTDRIETVTSEPKMDSNTVSISDVILRQ